MIVSYTQVSSSSVFTYHVSMASEQAGIREPGYKAKQMRP